MNSKKNMNIAVIGLGYVGLPLAVEFGKLFNVIGFDISSNRITELKNGYDSTNEITKDDLLNSKKLCLTSDSNYLRDSNVFIITVPTPVNKYNKPDLEPIKSATRLVGKFLNKDNVVVYESTVYPGCTEEICVPILENISQLKYNKHFYCGYSPERINPGDKKHNLVNIVKITSGSNLKVAKFIDSLYQKIIKAGTYMAPSIAVAEAAKVIENTQRDVNIALINELALIFKKIDLDTKEVLKAARTKWNFLHFEPGLVGGHCIGVDPYYLTHKATEVGYNPEIILAGRRINDKMGSFIASTLIEELTMQGINPLEAKVAILGLTFKENCPDLRNTKVLDVFNSLSNYNCKVVVTDDYASHEAAKKSYDIDLTNFEDIANQDALIFAVAHKKYVKLNDVDITKMIKPGGVIMDLKSIFPLEKFKKLKIRHWRL